MRRLLAKMIEDAQQGPAVDPLMNQLEQAMEAGHVADVRNLSREITEILLAKV